MAAIDFVNVLKYIYIIYLQACPWFSKAVVGDDDEPHTNQRTTMSKHKVG